SLAVKLDLLPNANRDALAERVFIRPETFGGGFVDDHHARMRHVIRFREIAARSQRNAHHREITGRDLVSVGAWAVYWRSRTIIKAERTRAARTAEWQAGPESGRLDAGNGAHFFERATEELGLLPILRIFGARQVDRASHNILGLKAGIDLK